MYHGEFDTKATDKLKLWGFFISCVNDKIVSVQLLAQLFCHCPGIVGGCKRRHAKTLTFSNISVITEDIYLKLRVVVHYQKGNHAIPVGR